MKQEWRRGDDPIHSLKVNYGDVKGKPVGIGALHRIPDTNKKKRDDAHDFFAQEKLLIEYWELVANAGSDRNWKGMFIATLVILAVFGLIILSVIWLTPPEETGIIGETITFDDFFTRKLAGETFNGTWISDTQIVFRDEVDGLSILDVSGKLNRSTLVPNRTFTDLNAMYYGVSANQKYVWLAHDYYKNFRHSFWAKYTIIDVDKGTKELVDEITEPESESRDSNNPPKQQIPFLQYLTWSPQGDAYAYVYRCNIFYKPGIKSSKVYPITTDGTQKTEDGPIYNGIPDWVYEEEIIGDNSALWFSPDGSRMAYVRFNDSLVEKVDLPSYNENIDYPYISYKSIKYPKPGTPNPTVELHVVDLPGSDGRSNDEGQNSYLLLPPTIIRQSDHYIVSVSWINSTAVSAIWMNRNQNLSVVVHCLQQNNWMCYEVYRETARNKGWVDLYTPPLYAPSSNNGENKNDGTSEEFIIRAPILDGKNGYYRHIMRVRFGNSAIQKPLTHGQFDVAKVHGWNENDGYVYYSASPPGKPEHLHLYRIYALSGPKPHSEDNNSQTKGEDSITEPECLTCHLTYLVNETESEVSLFLRKHSSVTDSESTGIEDIIPVQEVLKGCLYNTAKFSKGMSYYVLNCKGPGIPKVLLFETKTNKQIAVLNSNLDLAKTVSNMSLPLVRIFDVPLSTASQSSEFSSSSSSNNMGDEKASVYNASVKLYLPPEINVKTFMSYPLVVQVYAGPSSYAVKEEWKMDEWSAYLAGSKKIIVAMIDGRGSGNSGDRRQFEIWHRLGTVEIEDQIAVTNYLIKNLPIIDPKRVAVWGWSYGGYATLAILGNERQDICTCGISVAPVTNWRYYDSVYSERYMGQPDLSGNFRGYQESNIMQKFRNLQRGNVTERKLYIIHGSMDDNVHLQHSMTLSKELIRQGIMFKQQVYPDASHSLSTVRKHFYLSMEQFLNNECFGNSLNATDAGRWL